MAALFACTKCNSRHPFEELSQGQQLCKDCRGNFPLIKCTYCRTEFQDCSSKGSSTSVCKKCEANVKLYGKPSACEYCNIIAAFIGAKCQRCTNSEKRYGPPVTCEQCKQRCAFDRKDDSRKKVDGKLLCWLCTLSYKRALAKTKQSSSSHSRHQSLNKSSRDHRSSTSSSVQSHKRPSSHSSKIKKEHSPSKKPRTELSKSTNGNLPSSESTLLDTSTSDHVVAMHQLKDQIANLQRQLQLKDQQILAREKQAGEAKAQHGVIERELRLKIQAMEKNHGDTVEDLQSKVRVLQKQVITLNKANKKGKDTESPSRL
ncbi:LOW QUALITY PROTEIN: protein FAM76A-like [Uloborus diversus]|uniref:LOW QUALITY PROTEIN: protein FAM76A-like n=1 Tax=Uloborus diversus TaxID=327109 RepID=UPI00240A899F|nr:LOW QUALITY PROTEIN: protein FAM76A-like [Uloborus diversus]